MLLKNKIIDFYKENNWCRAIGIWGVDYEMEIGQNCPMSRDLYENENPNHGNEMEGTCATSLLNCMGFHFEENQFENELNTMIDYHYKNYVKKFRYIIAGTDYRYGDDENEIIITNAEIVAKI